MSFRLSSIGLAVAIAVAFGACADDGGRVLHPEALAAGGEVGTSGGVLGWPAGGEPGAGAAGQAGAGGQTSGPKTVLVVLEGFRSELLSPEQTPNLWAMAESGVRFANHHSVLPSNRVAVAASMATGRLPGRHGVLGERMYLPGVVARDSKGRALDTSQPIRIDDHGTLEALQRALPDGLLGAQGLFQVAQSAGLHTAVIGRAGPASLFDVERTGWVLDDNYVYPRAFAEEVLSLGLGLPNDASVLLPDLAAKTAYQAILEGDYYAGEGDTFGGTEALRGFGISGGFRLFPNTRVLNPLLPELHGYDSARALEVAAAGKVVSQGPADLVVLWLRDPGETALRVGPGGEATKDAVAKIDTALGELRARLPEGSNLLVTSDGGVSALAGDRRFFPRWGLGVAPGKTAYLPSRKVSDPLGFVEFEAPGGVPTDGAVRLVDLLNRSGFSAYDGEPCLAGHAYTTYRDWNQSDWKEECPGGALTGPALVPAEPDPGAIIVASNGGAELLYLPSHRRTQIAKVVSFLQGRPEIGAIFLAPRYGDVAGTLSLGLLGFSEHTQLDILVTYAWDADDAVAFAPLMQQVAPDKQRLDALCGELTPCRLGLFCGQIPGKAAPTCRFCPAGRPREAASCQVSEAEFEQAQAESTYIPELQGCEELAVCAPGLSCSYAQCVRPGAPPSWKQTDAPADYLRGSSYGAMSGVHFAFDLGSVSANGTALRDDYFGVRGGSSPAELSAFLIAVGPAFKSHTVIDAPTGVVDLAPTLLHLLEAGLERKLGKIDGRLLEEAFVDAGEPPSSEPLPQRVASVSVPFFAPNSPESTSATRLTAAGRYSSRLEGVSVTLGERTFEYVTLAGAERDGLACTVDADCPSGVGCGAKGVCLITPSCVDGVKNGVESDADCGFDAKCRPCYVGQGCVKNQDCESLRCQAGACQPL